MKKDNKTKLYDYDLEDVKKICVKHFVQNLGHQVKAKHRYHVTNSPLSDDTNPSFVIYPENTFYDFSTGVGGTIIDLVMNLYNLEFKQAVEFLNIKDSNKAVVVSRPKKTKQSDVKFNIETYYSKSKDNIMAVAKYMVGRALTYNECNAGMYFIKKDNKWESNLSLMFYHRDEFGNICGAKFRSVDPEDEQRWSSRGRLFYHVLEYIQCSDALPRIFITESETSSNSLFNYLKESGRKNFVILCFGGVNSAPKILPLKYDWTNKHRYILIDYDGSEEDYNKRIKALDHFKAKDIKLALPKGEDINSMYMKKEMKQFNNLFDKVF
jgi:hypothetical protein